MAKVIHIPAYMSYVQLEQAYTRSGAKQGDLAFEMYEHVMTISVRYNNKALKVLSRFLDEAGLTRAARVWFREDHLFAEFDETCWNSTHHSDMSAEELSKLD